MEDVSSMKQCPKCRVLIRDHRKFQRHVKECLILNKPEAISMQRDHSPKRETTSSIQISQTVGTEKQKMHCPYCPKTFTLKGNWQRHVKQKHATMRPSRVQCSYCPMTFSRKANCERHVKQKHSFMRAFQVQFPYCVATFTEKESCERHVNHKHSTEEGDKQTEDKLRFDSIHSSRIPWNHNWEARLHSRLLSLSDGKDFMEQWRFIRSIDTHSYESSCPCGKREIRYLYFIQNRFNGNMTFVGSECRKLFKKELSNVIYYFWYLISHGVRGKFVGEGTNGRQRFKLNVKTNLVKKRFMVNASLQE